MKIINILLGILLVIGTVFAQPTSDTQGSGGNNYYLLVSAYASSSNVAKNTDFYITVDASSNQGIEKIVYDKDGSTTLCGYGNTCTGSWTLKESQVGDKTYTFTTYGATNVQKTVTVSVKDSTGTATQSPPTVTSYAPTQISKGSVFTINTNANGVGSATIEKIITTDMTTSQDNTKLCGYASYCSDSYSKTFLYAGTYSFKIIAYDSNGKTTDNTITVNVFEGNVLSDSTKPTVTITSSNYFPALGESFVLTITAHDETNLASVKLKNVNTGDIEVLGCTVNTKDCTQTKSLSFTSAGQYVFEAIATDTNGNYQPNTATIKVGSSVTPTDTTTTPTSNPTSSSGSSSSGGLFNGPIISYKISPQDAHAGEKILFNASNTRSDQSNVNFVKFIWDFNGDDKDDIEATSPEVWYTYNTEGFYNVRLSVTDSNGHTSYDYRSIRILPCCRASISSTTGTFNITVYDKYGKIVKDALVTLTSNTSVSGRNTNENGTTLITVESGCYTVTIKKDGYSFEEMKNVCIKTSETKSIQINQRKSYLEESILKVAKGIKYLFTTLKGLLIVIPIAILIAAVIIALVYYNRDPREDEQNFEFEPHPDYEP